MKFFIRQALKFLIKLANRKPDKIQSKVALLFCEPMQKILQILNDSNPDNEAQIEQLFDTELITFLQRAKELKQEWERHKQTASGLLNHSSK